MVSFGFLTYSSIYACKTSSRGKTIRLNLVDKGDGQILKNEGLIVLRRQRIFRITNEAEQQGCRLSYPDLAALLLTSLSTLKRDIAFLRKNGLRVPLGMRRRRRRESMELLNAG